MFDISFLHTPPANHTVCHGRIQIGEFTEVFESPLDYWSKSEYESQWHSGVRRIVEERADSCIITSLTEPSSANFLFWWPIYLDGRHVVFQNQVLFLKQCESEFEANRPWLSLRPRQTMSEDGNRISEWRVHATLLEDWLTKRVARGDAGNS